MNKTMKAAGIGLIALSASMFANAADAAQKIGYINTAQVFQALPQREVVLQKMQADFKDKATELQSIQAEAKTKIQKLQRDGQLMKPDEVEKLKIDISQLESKYKIKAQAFEKMRAQREASEKAKLFKVIQTAVKKVAEKKGYDLVIDTQALQYAKPEFNLSDDVIKTLK